MTDNNKGVNMTSDRLHMLEERVSHTDQRVTELAQGVATIQASQSSMAAVLDKVADRVNEPNRTNWIGVVGACVSVISILGLGVALYTGPLAARLDRHADLIEYQQAEHAKGAGTRGKFEVRLEHLEEQEKRDYEADAALEQRLELVEGMVREGKISRKAIGEYLKELRQDFHNHLGVNSHD